MIVALLAAALLALTAPTVADAHGEGDGHMGHAGPMALSGVGTLTIEGFHVELLGDPAPLAAGRSSAVVARISSAATDEPVSGGTVSLGVGDDGDLVPAGEVTWAGSYTASLTAPRSGVTQVRVAITALQARHFHPALVLGFPVEVAPAPGIAWQTWSALLAVLAIAVVGLYAVALRARLGTPAAEATNLLAVPWLRGLITSRWLQPALQAPLLILMAVVVVLGFVDVQDGGKNLATKLTWTIWWAGVIFTFLLVGRVWCLACPFGALNEWTARLAGPLRRLPRPLRSLWWATALFLLLTWADEQLGVVRSPRVTAWIVIVFAALAIAVGLAYERRSFCRYLCPIGGLIGVYSMTAPLELRARDAAVCRGHAEKTCFSGGPHSRGCPMFEFPHTMDRNTYCNLCGECVSGCAHDNLVLRFRAFGRDLWASGRRALDEAFLAVALVALTLLVTAEMLTAWPGWISGLARWLPGIVRTTLKPVTYLGLVETLVLFGGTLVVAPLLVLGAAALADRLAGRPLGVRRTFVVFGYMFVPVGLAMHLAHNLSHLLLEGGGLVPVVQRTVALYTPFSLGEPDWSAGPLLSPAVIGPLQMAIVVAFYALSLVAGHRLALRTYADARVASRALVPLAVLSLLFTILGIVLLNQPMGMRHAM